LKYKNEKRHVILIAVYLLCLTVGIGLLYLTDLMYLAPIHATSIALIIYIAAKIIKKLQKLMDKSKTPDIKNLDFLPLMLIAAYLLIRGRFENMPLWVEICFCAVPIVISSFLIYRKFKAGAVSKTRIWILLGVVLLTVAWTGYEIMKS
jgi:hypothetical protein